MTLAEHRHMALGQGLLATPGQSHLPLGVTQAPALKWAARALLLMAAAVLLAWTGALVVQAASGQGTWRAPGIALVLGSAWLWMAWPLWQGLERSAMLPLHWGGLPSFRPDQGVQDAISGWSVPGWPHAVSVRVVFDLGPWLLVKMASMAPHGATLQAWFWVDARLGLQGIAGHHLRALLFSTRANDVGRGQSPQADGRTVMASSTDIQRQWTTLLSSFKTIGQDAEVGAVPQEIGARGIAMADRDFAETVILAFPHRPSTERGGQS